MLASEEQSFVHSALSLLAIPGSCSSRANEVVEAKMLHRAGMQNPRRGFLQASLAGAGVGLPAGNIRKIEKAPRPVALPANVAIKGLQQPGTPGARQSGEIQQYLVARHAAGKAVGRQGGCSTHQELGNRGPCTLAFCRHRRQTALEQPNVGTEERQIVVSIGLVELAQCSQIPGE